MGDAANWSQLRAGGTSCEGSAPFKHTGDCGEIHSQRACPPKARPHVRAPTLGTVITAST